MISLNEHEKENMILSLISIGLQRILKLKAISPRLAGLEIVSEDLRFSGWTLEIYVRESDGLVREIKDLRKSQVHAEEARDDMEIVCVLYEKEIIKTLRCYHKIFLKDVLFPF